MHRHTRTLILSLLLVAGSIEAAGDADARASRAFAEMDRLFEDFRLDAHVPGLVYGVVIDGRLAHVQGLGVRDLESKRPVDADTLFRIASMTKSFTALSILQLRDEGRLALDASAEKYLPEIRDWKYPTADSPRIRVRELLTHTAGLVTDDPWGDRQTPLPEEDFTRLLRDGVPFTRVPATAMEYSNMGYAMLGRIVTNVSRRPYKEFVRSTLLEPLHMDASGYDATAAPAGQRALGYRWEDGAWRPEPTLLHGAFGAMGGLQTSASDYAKYVAWLLSAWPPRDDPDNGPVKRASVRELAQGANYPALMHRAGDAGADACPQATTYGMGMDMTIDCELGKTLSHSGGYPGYGSHVLLLPQHGIGIFAFSNRTYADVDRPVWQAALVLKRAGMLRSGSTPVSPLLAEAYAAVARIHAAGSVSAETPLLAMNFLLDRTAEGWARDLAALRTETGACATDAPIEATGALSGDFTWRCEHGRVRGSLLLAPSRTAQIQALRLEREVP